MGFALWQAQIGRKHRDAKILRGFGGAGVLEVVADHDGDTYRAVSTVKARRCRLRASRVPEGIQEGHQDAGGRDERHPPAAQGGGGTPCGKKARKKRDEVCASVEESSGNVFADLGLKNPEELLAKAQLVQRIADIIAERKLTQARAAKLLGVDQPKVSAHLRGKLEAFSTDRLFRFLNALGRDVEIIIRPARHDAEADTRVISA